MAVASTTTFISLGHVLQAHGHNFCLLDPQVLSQQQAGSKIAWYNPNLTDSQHSKPVHDYLQYSSSGVRLACAPAAALPLRRLCVTSCSMVLSLCPDTGDAGPAMPMNNSNALCCADGAALCTHVSWCVLGSSSCFCSDRGFLWLLCCLLSL